MAPEGVFLKSSTHPRAYGTFARLLGKYVREEKLIPLEEAVRKLSGLPATNLGLSGAGFLKPGMFADVVVFDPATIADRATYKEPHQYAVGMRHVFVNGVQVLKDGEHTGALPGRAVYGPGRVTPHARSAGDGSDGRSPYPPRAAWPSPGPAASLRANLIRQAVAEGWDVVGAVRSDRGAQAVRRPAAGRASSADWSAAHSHARSPGPAPSCTSHRSARARRGHLRKPSTSRALEP
jgi:hypothetical protein